MGTHSKLLADYAYFKERPAELSVFNQANVNTLTCLCGVVYRWQRKNSTADRQPIRDITDLNNDISYFLRRIEYKRYRGIRTVIEAYFNAAAADPAMVEHLKPRPPRPSQPAIHRPRAAVLQPDR